MSGASEKSFQQQILQLAHLTGWRSYHTFDSRRSAPGFPDLVLVRPPRLLFVELKSERGRLRPEQRVWLEDLALCDSVHARLWRPGDWTEIEKALCQRANREELY